MTEQDTTAANLPTAATIAARQAKARAFLAAWLMDELRACFAVSTDDEQRKINAHLTAAHNEWRAGRGLVIAP